MDFSKQSLHYHGDGHNHHGEDSTSARVMRSSATTWAVVACIGAAALIAAVSALLVLRRRYAGYSQAPAGAAIAVEAVASEKVECGPGAEELAAMQTNGYENPTYKYFELRGKAEEPSEA
jgi:hypothetical protein